MSTPYMTVAAAAVLLDCSTRTIHRRIIAGELTDLRMGDSKRAPIRLLETEVHALLRPRPA